MIGYVGSIEKQTLENTYFTVPVVSALAVPSEQLSLRAFEVSSDTTIAQWVKGDPKQRKMNSITAIFHASFLILFVR